MIKKRNVLNPGTKGQRIPGLRIRLPLGASQKAVEAAKKLGEAELAGKGKILRRPKKVDVAVYEQQIAQTIGKRTFELSAGPHKSTKYIITGNGKHLKIIEDNGRHKQAEITDINKFANAVRKIAFQMGL